MLESELTSTELQIEEGKNQLRRRLEGHLLKFTNVVKGYQYRWCVLDPDLGNVEYYEKEDRKHSKKPRGILSLTYASVCPSDEDSQAFIIHAANGDTLKLKAADAKERQFWVNRIRAVAEYHTEQTESNPSINALTPSSVRTLSTVSSAHLTSSSRYRSTGHDTSASSVNSSCPAIGHTMDSNTLPNDPAQKHHGDPNCSVPKCPVFCPTGSDDVHTQLRELLRQYDMEHHALVTTVEAASICIPELTEVYKTLLLSKATSQAMLSSLQRCVELLRRRGFNPPVSLNEQRVECNTNPIPGTLANVVADEPVGDPNEISLTDGLFPSPILNLNVESSRLPEFPGGAIRDPVCELENELGSVEGQKNVILHILSQLKFGSNLTKVTLPTFILEKRSLLEMFADYMSHPDLFIQINRGATPEDRMLSFVHWYLTAFHSGRKDKVAKKPYNPIIGETFHCCWVLPTECVGIGEDQTPANTDAVAAQSQHTSTESQSDRLVISYCAEQVSHHPPVTAFHFDCPSEQMELTGSVHTRSKYHGLSVGVSMIGKTTLRLGQHNEEYNFSLPSAYARSILSVPWVELADKVTVNCPQSGFSATVTFHTKPMRGNKVHRISAEVFSPHPVMSTSENGPVTSNMIGRFTGQWNGQIHCERFTNGGSTFSIDVNKLPVFCKHVYPLDQQQPEESRRLWQHVTNALRLGDLHTATDRKLELEERQRVSEKYRVSHHILFPVKFFNRDGTNWTFGAVQNSLGEIES